MTVVRLISQTDNPDEDETVIAVTTGTGGADGVAVLEIELEAESEDIEILDVYLALPTNMGARVGGSDVAMSDTALENVYDRFTLQLGNTTADADDYVATKTFAAEVTPGDGGYKNLQSDLTGLRLIEFEDVNEVVREGDDNTETFDLMFDFNGIDDNDGVAGQFIKGSKLIVVWEGSDSDTTNVTESAAIGADFTVALPFPTVPIVSTTKSSGSLSFGSGVKIYEFTVHADDEGDIYLGQIGLDISLNGSLMTNVEIHRGTEEGTPRATLASASDGGEDNELEFTNDGTVSGTPSPEKIDAGESRTYSVFATITGTPNDDTVTVGLNVDGEEPNPQAGRQYADAKVVDGVGFVWSPNALENDGATTSNADWFTGWTVVKRSDVKRWELRE